MKTFPKFINKFIKFFTMKILDPGAWKKQGSNQFFEN